MRKIEKSHPNHHSKNHVATTILVISLLAFLGIILEIQNANISRFPSYGQGIYTPPDVSTAAKTRYFVKTDRDDIWMQYPTLHEFENGFSALLSPSDIQRLQSLGIELEKIDFMTPSDQPQCGDGVCQGNEASTCPSDCQASPGAVSRSCYPTSQRPWGILKVNGGQIGAGTGMKIAIIDTGVKKDHLDLKVTLCKDFTGKRTGNTCADNYNHGTHVAGIAAANGGSDGQGIFGVAPGAEIYALKVCTDGGLCYQDNMAKGIRYAADQGANIISISLEGSTQNTVLKDAIDYAASKGSLLVSIAGNKGPAENTIQYPGANVKVIAVGAIDSSEVVPSFSSRGVNDGDYIIEEREVEVGAPGVSIESTLNNGCYGLKSGTSMSAPHIAGLAAKNWQGSASVTRTYIQNRAKLHDLHTVGDDSASGFGLPIAQ